MRGINSMGDGFDRYSKDLLLAKIESTEIDIENELEIEDIENDEKEQRKLYVDKADKSTSDLFRMIIENELELQPDYQRNFVWDKKMMSKFIESLLLSIPIPTIFLAENDDDTFEVIDGQQRLTTIFAFMKQKLSDDEQAKLKDNLQQVDKLTLTGLETLKQYNKRNYLDLEEVQRKFNNVSLPIVIIKKDSSEDIKYDIFSRINSGSVKLNNQELLNVMYRGCLIKKLNDVSTLDLVDNIFGNRPVLKKRFGYHEILLRSIAIECFINDKTWKLQDVNVKNSSILKKKSKRYNGRLSSIVLDYLKEFRNDTEEAERLEAFVLDAINKVQIVFEDEAFLRVSKVGSKSINKTIAELQLVVLSRFNLEKVKTYKEEIRDSFKEFLAKSDENIFIRGTNNSSNVERRYEWGKILSSKLNEL